MKKFTAVVLFAFLLSIATPQKSYAWGKVGPGTVAVIIVGGVVLSPLLITGGLLYAGALGVGKAVRAISKKQESGKGSKGSDDEHEEASSAQLEFTQSVINKFFVALAVDLRGRVNLLRAQSPDFDPENKMEQITQFVEEVARKEKIDVNDVLCQFRQKFLPQMEAGSLDITKLGKMFRQYWEQKSVFPEEFAEAAHKHLGLSHEASEMVFATLYSLTLKYNIKLGEQNN